MMLIKGLDGCGLSFFIYDLIRNGTKILVVVNDEKNIEDLMANISSVSEYYNYITGKRIEIKLLGFLKSDIFGRINTLYQLKNGIGDCVITTKEALFKRTIPKDEFRTFDLSYGTEYKYSNIIHLLLEMGYERQEFVEQEGDFSVRGEIIDLWSPQNDMPVRLVFEDDKVISIKKFDVFTQRSTEEIIQTQVFPAKESEKSLLFEYLSNEFKIFCDEKIDINDKEIILYDKFSPQAIDYGFVSTSSYYGNTELFINETLNFLNRGFKVNIFCKNESELEVITDLLDRKKILGVNIFLCNFTVGGINYKTNEVFITYSEIFSTFKQKVKIPKFKFGRRVQEIYELSKGDYVVHEDYGIGKYIGLKQLNIAGLESEFIVIEYKGGDILYVPIYDFHRLQKYIGIEGKRPRLYSLDSVTWNRIKLKTRQAASEFAKELFKIYANKKKITRAPYPEDDILDKELASSFIYTETQDQLNAINQTKSDMYKPYPMDRVIIGDVGYGKTEVAIRAAFKAANSGRQTALLCPTTILAWQHYRTFTERLAPFPVKIALLTRFQSKKEQLKILDELRNGIIDIIIGTHRLLQNDVIFKNLGLLIIDDEHKFGVKQKEKIKILKSDIDTLSLTATPIPRTFTMALSGLKDISLIETPPEGRLPIETYIGPYNEKLVKDAISFEITRGGQVFYVHNHIQTIYHKQHELKRLLPEVRFDVIHAKMKTQQIEKIMWKFLNKKIDCLVSTTIIEAGLDIPNVNTMIIEHAEEFGLSQIYQLRGRIGRTYIKAYCYLFYSPGTLTETAKKRLKSFFEFSRFPSAFKLALRDLEIRGAGELLGTRQHGFVRDVGLEMFSKMLFDEIRILKNEPMIPEKQKTKIEIPTNAYIPKEYISNDELRIYFYKRIVNSENLNELEEIYNELTDRFGEFPEEVMSLFTIAEISIISTKIGIRKIKQKNGYFYLEYKPGMVKELKTKDIKELKELIKGFSVV